MKWHKNIFQLLFMYNLNKLVVLFIIKTKIGQYINTPNTYQHMRFQQKPFDNFVDIYTYNCLRCWYIHRINKPEDFHIHLCRYSFLDNKILNVLEIIQFSVEGKNNYLPPVLSNWYPSLHSHLNVPNIFSQFPNTQRLLNMWHSFMSTQSSIILESVKIKNT